MRKYTIILLLLSVFTLAGCSENTYKLTYNVKEDTLYAEEICTENERITFPENPNIEGYTFEGWYTSTDYLVEFTTNQTCTSDMIFYGKLTQQTTSSFTLSFVDFDDTLLQSNIYLEGSDISNITIPTPTRTGYIFTGWDQSIPSKMPGNNVIIKAQYDEVVTQTQYTLSFVDYDGTVLKTIDYYEGTDLSGVTPPNNPTREGYTFSGWDQSIPSTMPKNNLIITAVYEEIPLDTFNITFLDLDGNILVSYTLESGETTSSIAIPELPQKEGYEVLDWNLDLPSVMPEHNLTIAPIYYSSFSMQKELGNINTHEYMINGDYIIYILNNYSWATEESEREYSTLNILKISDDTYKRVINIDKANAYMYNLESFGTKVVLASPAKDLYNGGGSGAIYFYDLLDESFYQELTHNYSNVTNLGTYLISDPNDSVLIISREHTYANNDKTFTEYLEVEIQSGIPVINRVLSEQYPSIQPTSYGGIQYEDYFVNIKVLENDYVFEIWNFNDLTQPQKSISLTQALGTMGITGSLDMIYYAQESNGYFTNNFSVGEDNYFFSINLTSSDPTLSIYQASDFLPNPGDLKSLIQYTHQNYSVTYTRVYDGSTGYSTVQIQFRDNTSQVIHTIDEKLLNITEANNIIVITTQNQTTSQIKVYLYDLSDNSNLQLIDTLEFNTDIEPMISHDGANIMLLFVNYNDLETFVYIDIENLTLK